MFSSCTDHLVDFNHKVDTRFAQEWMTPREKEKESLLKRPQLGPNHHTSSEQSFDLAP